MLGKFSLTPDTAFLASKYSRKTGTDAIDISITPLHPGEGKS